MSGQHFLRHLIQPNMGRCKPILNSPRDIEPDKVFTEDLASMKAKFRYTLFLSIANYNLSPLLL